MSNILKAVQRFVGNQRKEEQITGTILNYFKNALDVSIQRNPHAKKLANVTELNLLGTDLTNLPLLKNSRGEIIINNQGSLIYTE